MTKITRPMHMCSKLVKESSLILVENAEIDIMKKCYLDMRLALEKKDKDVALLKEGNARHAAITKESREVGRDFSGY